MKKTDPPRTGLFGDEDGTMELLPDNGDAAALATRAFGYDDSNKSDGGVPGLVKSLAITHGGDTIIASGRSTSKVNAIFVTGTMLVLLVRGKKKGMTSTHPLPLPSLIARPPTRI